MNIPPIQLLDIVALTVDLPEYNCDRGQVGTVVETLANGTVQIFFVNVADNVCHFLQYTRQ